MNIALVGKFTDAWRVESLVQRALWSLGHEVYGINIVRMPVEPDWSTIPVFDLDGEPVRECKRQAYAADVQASMTQLDGITEVDVTLVLQGYGIPAAALDDLRRRTQRPVVLWHGEVMGEAWPPTDPVVLGKVAWLHQNIHAYDLVCHNCRTSLQMLRFLGAEKVACVPVNGVDPQVHRRLPDVPKALDIAIYGWASERRATIATEVIELVRRARPGLRYAWVDAAGTCYGETLSRFINMSKLVLNVHFSESLNTECRMYESLGCGTPVVSEPLSMMELFPAGMGVLYGDTVQALATQVEAILELPEAAYLDLARAGSDWVAPYTYEARCTQLLETIAKELA